MVGDDRTVSEAPLTLRVFPRDKAGTRDLARDDWRLAVARAVARSRNCIPKKAGSTMSFAASPCPIQKQSHERSHPYSNSGGRISKQSRLCARQARWQISGRSRNGSWLVISSRPLLTFLSLSFCSSRDSSPSWWRVFSSAVRPTSNHSLPGIRGFIFFSYRRSACGCGRRNVASARWNCC